MDGNRFLNDCSELGQFFALHTDEITSAEKEVKVFNKIPCLNKNI